MAGKTACYSNTSMGKESGNNIRSSRTVDNKLPSYIVGAVLLTTEKDIAVLKNVENARK